MLEKTHDELRMVFVVRKDLKMPRGKIGSQLGHATERLLFFNAEEQQDQIVIPLTAELKSWRRSKLRTKIVLRVDSLEALEQFYNEAVSRAIPAVKVVDAGLTCFDGNPTCTVAGIGPVLPQHHQAFTHGLKLLN